MSLLLVAPRMRVQLRVVAVAVSCSVCWTLGHALLLERTTTTRAHFLSSVAASFTGVAVLGMDPTECDAAAAAVGSNNPRYIDKNLEMKYGETPGTFFCFGRGIECRKISGMRKIMTTNTNIPPPSCNKIQTATPARAASWCVASRVIQHRTNSPYNRSDWCKNGRLNRPFNLKISFGPIKTMTASFTESLGWSITLMNLPWHP